jgi:hypothetical protein
MRLGLIFLLAAALQMTTTSNASAASAGRSHSHHNHHIAHQYFAHQYNAHQYNHIAHHYNSSRTVADGRPSAWCGWEMRQLVGGNPGPEFNLARNWAHWGRPASGPAPGVVGVMAHHVFKVVQVLGRGTVLAISGNDGHAVRVRPRSTAGVIAWREP